MKNTLVLTLAAAWVFAVGVAHADDSLLSPRARENRTRVVSSGGNDVRQRFEYRGGKSVYAGHSTVTNKASERDLVREQRNVVYTGKNPLRDQQRTFEIAPVK
jgi:hypothetical protein